MIGSLSTLLASAEGSVMDAGGSVRSLIEIGFGSLQGLLGEAA